MRFNIVLLQQIVKDYVLDFNLKDIGATARCKFLTAVSIDVGDQKLLVMRISRVPFSNVDIVSDSKEKSWLHLTRDYRADVSRM